MITQRRTLLSLSLSLFLIALYFLSFKAYAVNTDELLLFDMTESFSRRQNFDETFFFDVAPLRTKAIDPLAKPRENYEPLHAVLASPLFLLAQAAPDIGLMHTTWLFNIFVTALTAVVIFWGGLMLGYDERVALITALLYGVATQAWPYARTFFREPVSTLFMLICILAAYQARTLLLQRRIPWWTGAVAILMFFLAILAKEATFLVLAIVLAFLFFPTREQWRFFLVGLGVGALLLLLVLSLSKLGIVGSNRYSLDRWLVNFDKVKLENISITLRGYLYSPGRGFFWYTPLFVLAPWGSYLLVKRGQWRLVAGVLVATFLFVLSYAITRRTIWWAGNSWGTRYIFQVVPLWMLLLLPVVEKVQQKRLPRWGLGGIVMLVMVSIAVQVFGFTVSIADHFSAIQTAGKIPGQEGIWSLAYSPWVMYWDLVKFDQIEIVWIGEQAWPTVLLGLGLLGLTLAFILWTWRVQQVRGVQWLIVASMPLFLMAYLVVGLVSIKDDSRYLPINLPNFLVFLEDVEDGVQAEDAVLIEPANDKLAFMNFFKKPVLVVTLPYAPGERPFPNYRPKIIAPNVERQAGPWTVAMIDQVAQNHARVWLIMGYGPHHTYTTRPAEHYLAQNWFPVEVIERSPIERAIRFEMIPAPQGNPQIVSQIEFGEQLALTGFDLPSGNTFDAGEVLPLSLVWQPTAQIVDDYIVTIQLLDKNGQLVAQRDSVPQGTFGLTSQWLIGKIYRDNHGLQLPAQLVAGDYALHVIVYRWQDQTRLVALEGESATSSDSAHVATITIR